MGAHHPNAVAVPSVLCKECHMCCAKCAKCAVPDVPNMLCQVCCAKCAKWAVSTVLCKCAVLMMDAIMMLIIDYESL